MKGWNRRFLESTRGRIVQLLRRGKASVSDLAAELDLTPNAVRAHIATLERDRLVRSSGKRPGVRKPETIYSLTPEAEYLFPKAYGLLLKLLLDVLHERVAPEEIESVIEEVARRVAAGYLPALEHRSFRERLDASLKVVREIGGLAEVQETDGAIRIRGYSCPLAAAVEGHPEVCRLAEVLLSELIGVPVHEHCERNGTHRCIFAVEQPSSFGPRDTL